MDIDDLLTPSCCVLAKQSVNSKKQLLELVSHLFHESYPAIKYKAILNALQSREKLGSTFMSHGVAIPHGRIDNLHGPIAALLVLEPAVNYNNDDEQVDIVLALLAPKDADDQHISALSTFADRLCNEDYREALRSAKDNNALFNAATRALDNYSLCELD